MENFGQDKEDFRRVMELHDQLNDAGRELVSMNVNKAFKNELILLEKVKELDEIIITLLEKSKVEAEEEGKLKDLLGKVKEEKQHVKTKIRNLELLVKLGDLAQNIARKSFKKQKQNDEELFDIMVETLNKEQPGNDVITPDSDLKDEIERVRENLRKKMNQHDDPSIDLNLEKS